MVGIPAGQEKYLCGNGRRSNMAKEGKPAFIFWNDFKKLKLCN
jgi:hypothetical protein